MDLNNDNQALLDCSSAQCPSAPPPDYPESKQPAAAPIYQPPGMTHPGAYQSPQAAAAPIFQPPGMTHPGAYQSQQAAAAPTNQPPGMTHPGAYQSPQAAAAPIYQPPGMTHPEKTTGMAPGMPYPTNPAYPASTPYAPGQNTVIVTQPGTVFSMQQQGRPPATGVIIFSCLVLWCCCWPIGLAAFIIAVMSTSEDYNSAVKYLKVSKYMSIAGLGIGVIFTPLFIWYQVERTKRVDAYNNYDY